ncbi:DUF5825 family protein [Streptomyces sp. NPDC102406]|uniref:DUF5825 family protein n=1 Tax=Streptomyces sp. NPDC102406 TaxID=3366171 RepID=UPI003812EC0E
MTAPPGDTSPATRPADSPASAPTIPAPTTAAPALPATVAHRRTGSDVHVSEPLHLCGDGPTATRAVQFLRECLSRGLSVTYDAVLPVPAPGPDTYNPRPEVPRPTPGTYDLRVLRHLPPPAEQPGEPPELTIWRADHAYGMLYHRRGPGFITVMDRRERPASARFTLDHPDLLAAFDALHEAMPLAALAPVHQEAAELLAAERLALIVDGWAVALPPRLRRWPVPCTGI